MSEIVNYGSMNFSTDEQIVGKWIDGKPIYQKTVHTGALPNSTERPIAHGISDIDEVIFMFGYSKKANNSAFIPLTYGAGNWCVAIRCDGSNIYLTTFTDDMTVYMDSYVTMQYTKTTD